MNNKGFTLLEMIIVLTIVALLFLLTLPNIQQKKEVIDNKGCEALVEVVNSQILLYQVDHTDYPTSVDELVNEGYLKESQKACSDGTSITITDGQAYAK